MVSMACVMHWDDQIAMRAMEMRPGVAAPVERDAAPLHRGRPDGSRDLRLPEGHSSECHLCAQSDRGGNHYRRSLPEALRRLVGCGVRWEMEIDTGRRESSVPTRLGADPTLMDRSAPTR